MLKIAWDSSYAHSLPPGHRFPMSKYELLPQQLLHEGTIVYENIFQPAAISTENVLLTHQENYWNRLQSLQLTASEIRRTGFPLSDSLVQRELIIMEGTRQCALYALNHGIAMNIAGGTHHAFSNKGEGFCLLNDIAIAANYLLHHQLANKILIVDLDVHQGNGTAAIFKDDARVFTFSMHGKNNYPLQKEISGLDVELPDQCDDQLYLSLLTSKLPQLIDTVKPDIVFYQSGVDILESDKLGRLKVSKQGCKKRDHFVLSQCFQHKLPLVISMGGGYSPDIRDIVDAHANTFRLAQEIFF
jgi:acetoin utilization deacetylase AcuC-like enzyme